MGFKCSFSYFCIVFVFVLWTILSKKNVFAYNILFYHSMATSSHRTAIWPLAEKLADIGHDVTYIFPVEKKVGYHPKIKEITPSKAVPLLKGFISDFDINIRLENRVEEWLLNVFQETFKICEAFYDSPEIKEWLAEPGLHFDLIFIDGVGDCGYGLVHKFKAKHILFAPLIVPMLLDPFGIIPESSSIPDIFFKSKPTEMGLFNRMKAVLCPLMWRYKYHEYLGLIEPIIKSKLNSSDMPAMTDIEQQASLIMVNAHFIEDYPMALPPMWVSISGLWCSRDKLKASKPLPNKIAKFVEDSDGFFYVSLGSATVASAMPKWMRDHFFNSFRAFPKHKFLWRWTGPIPDDTPQNVLLLPWFPQHDILAHPKIVAFLTQAGRPSTQEAICHGVPLITLPIFGDQDYNSDRLHYIAGTIKLDVGKLTTEILQKSFQEVMQNPEHRMKMKELSIMFRDRPIDPIDNALYWTHFVLRHNTTLMKPLSMNQTWWQRRLLDVYAAFLVIILSVLGSMGVTSYIVLKFTLRILCNPVMKVKKE